MKELVIYTLLSIFIGGVFTQKVAPGVPPQHYQQNQQYQQVPQYQQQNPQHHQQVPQHHPQANQPQYQQPHGHQPPPPQHHQQQHHQQPPTHHQQTGGHHDSGHHGGHHGSVLHTGNLQGERDHIAEHMEVPNIDTSKMSEQELQFHYFKMHDSDNNNKLDGCELIKSLIHWHEQGSKEQDASGQQRIDEKVFSDDELVSLIDPILQMDDISRDGYIDYPEFIKAQQKAAANQQQQQEQEHQED